MAKFGSYYGLCPLIDHKSLLGISTTEEPGAVVVTLGKNIAIKHKLSDQKQLHSWRTKDKFTSPVIYDDKLSKYAAAFNNSYVRVWTGDEEHLDKVKKLKFSYQIHTLLSCGGHSFILFKNGHILSLSEAIELRKTLDISPVIEEDDVIVDILHTYLGEDVYIGLIIENNKQNYLLWTVYNTVLKRNKFFKIHLDKVQLKLSGCMFHKKTDCVVFLTLWSDGRMFSNTLLPSDAAMNISSELFTTVDAIDYKQSVSMISLDENYIVMYGADNNNEGATLLIYNSQFRVTQSKQPLKLFTNGAKLWCIEENILLPVGQNLAVVPYYLATEQLAALVGSHKSVATEEIDDDISVVQEFVNVDWGTEKYNSEVPEVPVSQIPQLPVEIEQKVSELYKQGLPDNTIVEHLLPDIVEKQDIKSMLYVLNVFHDISDRLLIKFLKVILNSQSSSFDIISKDECEFLPNKFQPAGRMEMLDVILTKALSGVSILPVLRISLDLDDVVMLTDYICFMMSDHGHCLPGLDEFQTREKLITWASLLLDASFQKILLTKDEQCLSSLKRLRGLVNRDLQASDDWCEFSVLIQELSKGKEKKEKNVPNATYSIEVIDLY